MSFVTTLVLGFFAGSTILFGLLMGRVKASLPRLRPFLMCLAVGILLFLVVDVLSHAYEPIKAALNPLSGSLLTIRTVLFLGGLVLGLLGLVAYDKWRAARSGNPDAHLEPSQLSFLLALGIGMHNFGEGLAIGSSAHVGQLGLSTVLVVGFALHNATEGFGIIAPLASMTGKVPWTTLLTMGALGGGPTTMGTLVGWYSASTTMSVFFFTVAAGSLVYVIVQLLGVAQRIKIAPPLLYGGLLAGLLAGFVTDAIVTYAGA
jgi:ZIP family zinc transporter